MILIRELKVLKKNLPNVVMSLVDILKFDKGTDCCPNICIVYKIL